MSNIPRIYYYKENDCVNINITYVFMMKFLIILDMLLGLGLDILGSQIQEVVLDIRVVDSLPVVGIHLVVGILPAEDILLVVDNPLEVGIRLAVDNLPAVDNLLEVEDNLPVDNLIVDNRHLFIKKRSKTYLRIEHVTNRAILTCVFLWFEY